jgi:RecA-family ATPase
VPDDPDLSEYEAIKNKYRTPDGSAEVPDPSCLSLDYWLSREIAPPNFLMGEWLTTTSRAMLVAATGLGKTNLCMALGFAMAAGLPFLHWRGQHPARVLYIDGEMSRRLMAQRLAEAERRLGSRPAHFYILCRDDLEAMPPLNTECGFQCKSPTYSDLKSASVLI